MLSKPMAVILTVLEEADSLVYRTKLVKLIYLADNLYYEHFGRTITGLRYEWDDHGPNAVSNAIVKEADKLIHKKLVCMDVSTNEYGSPTYKYIVGPNIINVPDALLDPFEKQVLRDTVNRYRRYGVPKIVKASKETKPFKDARQYELLKLRQSSEYVDLIAAIKADTEFMAGITEGMKAETKGMSLEAVKQQYGL